MGDKLSGLLLVLDGLVLELFNDLVKTGRMPNVSEHLFARRLLNVKSAISCHPSSTYENMQAINTGSFPVDPGATYFSTHNSTIVDLLRADNPSKGNCAKRRTIFHHIPNSVSIHNPWNDGADDKHPSIYSFASAEYLFGWEGSNRAAVGRYLQTLKDKNPAFTEIWFPAYDRFGHILSENALSKKYEQFDDYFGKIINQLKQNGTYENTVIILLADHNMEQVSRNTNPNKIALLAGFKPRIARRRNDFDSRVFAYGYSVGQLYLEGDQINGLDEKLQNLAEQEPVEHVIRRINESLVMVYSKNAVVSIHKSADRYKMTLVSGRNPFGYNDDLVSALSEYHTAKVSLDLTFQEEQPDAVVSIAESLKHPDAPPIRFLAASGYDFGKIRNGTHFPAYFNANRIRTHGNLHKSQCEVPLIFAGSKDLVEYKEVDCARVIDWMPTFLQIAGYEVPKGLDGLSLLSVPPSIR